MLDYQEFYQDAIKNNSSITIFTKKYCKYCDMLLEELSNWQIKSIFKFILDPESEDYEPSATALKTITKMNTFPMMYVKQTLIGGYSEYQQLVMTNQFESMLEKNDISFESSF